MKRAVSNVSTNNIKRKNQSKFYKNHLNHIFQNIPCVYQNIQAKIKI